MTNKELMDLFGIVRVNILYDINTFFPNLRFYYKDNSYEDSEKLYMADLHLIKERLINEYLYNKLNSLYEKRNDIINKILNS